MLRRTLESDRILTQNLAVRNYAQHVHKNVVVPQHQGREANLATRRWALPATALGRVEPDTRYLSFRLSHRAGQTVAEERECRLRSSQIGWVFPRMLSAWPTQMGENRIQGGGSGADSEVVPGVPFTEKDAGFFSRQIARYGRVLMK